MTRRADDRTDEMLMLAHVDGDEAAFRSIFERWAPRILGFMRRDVFRSEDATDLTQQTFLHLHRARADFRRDAKLRPWLMTIALNLKRQYFRRRGVRPERLTEGDRFDAHQDRGAAQGDALLVAKEVRAAVARLPPKQREVVELHWFDELTFPEIGQVVGATTGAVRVRAHRGYERLRDTLGPLGLPEQLDATPTPAGVRR